MIHKAQKILICAGEASGDLLAADLVKILWQQQPYLQIIAMGGPQLRKAGATIIVDATALAIVGIFEVITHLKDIRIAFKKIQSVLKKDKPDLVILVDYPGFNLRIAKFAKKAGIKVLYYVSPQIWAWRYRRIKKIKAYVDHMAVLFPFEKILYQREKVPVTFVGHPLAAIAKPSLAKSDSYTTLQLNSNKPIISLFPGSRWQEITRLMPILMDSVTLIKKQIPDAQFAIPLANTIDKTRLQTFITHSDIQIIEQNTYNLLQITDVAIAASGTATLEIALLQVPLLIVYRTHFLTACFARLVIRLKYIGLCNIVAQEKIAMELLQEKAKPAAIAAEALRLLQDHEYRHRILIQLKTLPEKLQSDDSSSEKTAALVLQLLHE